MNADGTNHVLLTLMLLHHKYTGWEIFLRARTDLERTWITIGPARFPPEPHP